MILYRPIVCLVSQKPEEGLEAIKSQQFDFLVFEKNN